MEFGLFNQMYHPVHRRAERSEHECLMEELAIIEVADRVGFKYAWASEHHFLDEYSHLSASEAFMAYALARTTNIHIGSGIINITPAVSPPSRVAEKVAMLDHLGQGRFEWGTGRGSSSTEVFGFGIESMDITRAMYDETLPEIIAMMGDDEYGPFTGKFFSMPQRQVLPKPYTKPHPPIWVAAGSPGTFE
ncbi:MAG TPA: LLM class flavin-dependent oxidoreductase, partial [Ilumatobacteraceae bacterium]